MDKYLCRPKALLSFALLLITCFANAQLKLPNVIGSNMVLQRGQSLPIWGWADKESTVIVSFAGQQKKTQANADGYWKVQLSALKASAAPAQMLIVSGKDSVRLNNILVGEVWVCSGQSNMEYIMKNAYAKPVKTADSVALELSANKPLIRLFKVGKKLGVTDVVTNGWQECNGDALAQFSAAGYFFAKDIQEKLNVPVGMINTTWGGTPIEFWTPTQAYLNDPVYKGEIDETANKLKNLAVGQIYTSMVKPLAPFAIKGFLWYQGENNVIIHDGMHYADKMKTLVKSWRETWGNTKLPFYYVTLAPNYYTHRKDPIKHDSETLPLVWEAQTAALAIPNTEMIPISDLVDDLNNIHPPYKWIVGRRLANLALAKQYGYKGLEYAGPRYKSMKVSDGKISLSFTHAEGLKTSDNQAPNWFEIAGKDGIYKPATAEIKGNKVVLSNPEINDPEHARLGWNEIAQPNLVNSVGLPAMSFRSN
ncbi:sialate O-acetylesterase [Mucilaginibacter boryungensis]|uniref:Sialate O-acetylesterase n=1 Tax=Mucilaginibacter boryungensis TaxID=768480 RepID=A0ABR9XKH3_9SPHI|nr:sialate O-acetylesterase [Mucilaginibacter boryungensis]MBE9667569.1 sialate O-acetylesterase [Mucilaginibacter boryungensis]